MLRKHLQVPVDSTRIVVRRPVAREVPASGPPRADVARKKMIGSRALPAEGCVPRLGGSVRGTPSD